MEHDLREQLNRIESKLDNHLGRIATVEADVNWLKGSVRFGAGIITAIVTGFISLLYKYLHIG